MPLSIVPIRPNLSQTTLVDGSVELVTVTMKPLGNNHVFLVKALDQCCQPQKLRKKIQKNCYLPFNL